MTKITPEHLERGAVVYVRQSTAFQVARNLESQRRQYGLSERARQLGWSDVEVIDDDLGRSGAGARRPGFEKLLAAICEGRVGAVLSLEASRLARNGRDWHTLLEFCGLVRTLIVDEDAIYDPASPNDRLLLGMKGTMSEMELSVFRQRSIEAMKQKARRGELFLTVAVGYVKAGNDRIEKDADQRVQEAMALVFRKFAELQTIRQVLVWCRQEKVVQPALGNAQTTDRIIWRLPVYSTVHHMLTNPVYAGAYAFGRRTARVTIENGRKRVVRSMQRDWRQWEVLIRDRQDVVHRRLRPVSALEIVGAAVGLAGQRRRLPRHGAGGDARVGRVLGEADEPPVGREHMQARRAGRVLADPDPLSDQRSKLRRNVTAPADPEALPGHHPGAVPRRQRQQCVQRADIAGPRRRPQARRHAVQAAVGTASRRPPRATGRSAAEARPPSGEARRPAPRRAAGRRRT